MDPKRLVVITRYGGFLLGAILIAVGAKFKDADTIIGLFFIAFLAALFVLVGIGSWHQKRKQR